MKRIRIAAALVTTGLAAAAITLRWSHPTAFFAFAALTGVGVGGGSLIYLTTLLRRAAKVEGEARPGSRAA